MDRQSVPNHTVDPATGYLESNGYALAFDAKDKVRFLELYKQNGLKARNTCRQMGIAEDTLYRHLRTDQTFRKDFDNIREDYIEELEAVSMTNALQPKAVIERIFQLKANRPEKYGDVKSGPVAQITINIAPEMLEKAKKRAEIIDAQIVDNQSIQIKQDLQSDNNMDVSSKHVDNQRLTS